MKTAKEVAFKAFLSGYSQGITAQSISATIDFDYVHAQFEIWWNSIYHGSGDRKKFYPELSVFIDGKRYIQAE